MDSMISSRRRDGVACSQRSGAPMSRFRLAFSRVRALPLRLRALKREIRAERPDVERLAPVVDAAEGVYSSQVKHDSVP